MLAHYIMVSLNEEQTGYLVLKESDSEYLQHYIMVTLVSICYKQVYYHGLHGNDSKHLHDSENV